MPGLTAALASLEDVLEVQGSALGESELWSILCLSAEALQDILFKGNAFENEIPKVLVTPETVFMRPDGKIALDKQPLQPFLSSDFCAPEWRDETLSNTDSSVEKLWIFSLGMTLYKAADYKRTQYEDLDLSPELHAVLSDMCEEQPDLRLSLTQIMQLSSSYAANHMTESFSTHVMRMYELVFGSGDNISLELTNPSSISSSPHSAFGHHPHRDMYDIRPAPVGKSATNEDAPSRLSHTSTKIPSPRNHQHSMSMYTQPSTSRSQPNFDFAKTVEDSLKLSRSRHSSNHQNLPSKSMQMHANNFPSTQHFGHRPPSQPSFTHPSHHLLQVTQRSMPALHINYPMPAGGYVPSGHGPLPSQPQNLSFSNRDPYLQHAYNRLQQRRALLTAIRQSMSSENLVDPLTFLTNQHHYTIDDIKASANSLNYGAFHPDQHNQENYTPAALQVERPKSAHPRLTHTREALEDETDNVLNDPVIREAMISSTRAQPLHQHRSMPSVAKSQPSLPETPARLRPASRPSSSKAASRPPSRPASAKKPNKLKGGPEFVRLAAQPVRKLKDMYPSKTNSKVPPVSVLIELLNGERLQLFCPSITTGQQLFEVMLREVNLPEHFFFGLTHVMGGEHFFIDGQKKIEKYIPALRKKSLTNKKVNVAFTVHQRVKFYPRTQNLLKHISSSHLLYLQLRRDIVEDRLRTEDKEMIQLAGIALQAEYGDYDIRRHHLDYFVISYYFPQRALKRMAKAKQVIVNKHAACTGMTVPEAENKFIEFAMEMHEYGIHFYTVCKVRGDPLSQTWIGVTARGLALAETRSQQRSIVQRCSWENISKLSFNKEKFTIKPHMNTDDPSKITRYTESYKKSKYLIWLSEEHHSFLIQSMSAGSEFVHPYNRGVAGTEHTNTAVIEESAGVEDEYAADTYSDDVNELYDTEDLGEASSYQYQPPPHDNEPITAGDPDTLMSRRNQASTLPRRPSSRRREIEELNDEPALDHSPDAMSPPDIEETLSESLHARFDAIPSDSPEKRFTVVSLHRDPVSGIGLTLAGGTTGGVFVASITPGGSAESEGSIRVGDRLVAINGRSTEIISQKNATELIRKANGDVELIVSQPVLTAGQVANKHENHSTLNTYHSNDSDYDIDDNSLSDQPITAETVRGYNSLPHHRSKTPNLLEDEQARAALQAELEAEAAALKAEPQDGDDIMLQYQQQLAKYHPHQRAAAQGQPSIQLPTPPQADSISPQSPLVAQSNIRQQLDDLSSEDMGTPVHHQSSVTNIDDISSDENTEDEVTEASALNPSYQQQSVALRPPPSSISSSDMERPEERRLSAFASVQSKPPRPSQQSATENIELRQIKGENGRYRKSPTRKSPSSAQHQQELMTRLMTSPSASSTLSEHESDVYSSLNASQNKPKGVAAETHSNQTENSVMYDSGSDSTLRSDAQSYNRQHQLKTEEKSPGLKIAAALMNQRKSSPSHAQKQVEVNLEMKAVHSQQTKPVLPDYSDSDSAETESEDEEISVMMTGKPQSQSQQQRSESQTSTNTRGSVVSYTEPGQYDIKLKTPIDDHLEVGDQYELTMNKVNQSLGLNVTGGVNTSVKHGGIYVKSLVPRGPADMSARIHVGDRVLSVNTLHLTSVTHKQAVETLRNASTPVTLRMERGEPPAKTQIVSPMTVPSADPTPSLSAVTPISEDRDASSVTPVTSSSRTSTIRATNKTPDIEKLAFISSGNCSEIELTKGKSGLGFSVLGGKDPMSPDPRLSLVRVKKIFPLGAAAKSGKLLVGDVILRVNNKSVEGLSHGETVSLLRTAPSTVKLLICRPDPRILSPVSDSSHAVNNSGVTSRQLSSHSQESLNNVGQSPIMPQIIDQSNDTTRQGEDDDIDSETESDDSTETESQSPPDDTQVGQSQRSPVAELITPLQQQAYLSMPARNDMIDNRSTISAASSTTMGTQESSTSRDSVTTVVKSPAVQEFEASLKLRKPEYGLPTPIRELDDMLQANTSNHTSRSHSPSSISRTSSLNRSTGPRILNNLDIAAVSDKLTDIDRNPSINSENADKSDTASQSSEEYTEPAEEVHSEQIPANSPLGSKRTTPELEKTTPEPEMVTPEVTPELRASSPSQRATTPVAGDPPQFVADSRISDAVVTSSAPSTTESESEEEQPPTERMVSVTLEKDSYGSLGFSVAGAASLGGCYIKKIIKDPALSEGTLRAGDKLLEVNGFDITKLSNPAAVTLIKNQPPTVHITVLRPIGEDDEAPVKPPREDSDELSLSVPTETLNVIPEVSYDSSTSQQIEHVVTPSQSDEQYKAPEFTEADGDNENITEEKSVNLADMEFEEDRNPPPSSSPKIRLSAHSSRAQSDAEELPSQHNQSEAEELSPPHNKPQAESEESDFSSVGDDVPANVDDSWSSDSTESDMEEAAAGMIPDSHIGTPSRGSDLDSTLNKTIESLEAAFKESRIGTPSHESTASEREDNSEDALTDLRDSPRLRPLSNISQKESVSSWGDSIVDHSDDEDKHKSVLSLSPVDLRRKESQRSITDGGISTPGLSRNDSSFSKLSRHDSTHSNQSYLSTPPNISRNTSLKLPSSEESFMVTLTKPDGGSLGFSVVGKTVGSLVSICVKGLNKGGVAEKNGFINVGDRIVKINGEELVGEKDTELQKDCVRRLRQADGDIDLLLSRERADSYSDDLALTHDEDEHITGASDDQLGALSDAPSTGRLMSRNRMRMFGPSVTTTDEDSDMEGLGLGVGERDDLSDVIESLGGSVRRPDTANSHTSGTHSERSQLSQHRHHSQEISPEESVTESESSFDFDLPDESQFLESSIRLTRDDMRSPESDDTKRDSDSDTDHVLSRDDIMPNSTRNNTDAHPDDTDADDLLKDDDLAVTFRNNMGDWSAESPPQTIQRYDTSAIPGATIEAEYAEPGSSTAPKRASLYDDEQPLPGTSNQQVVISNKPSRPTGRSAGSTGRHSFPSTHTPSIAKPTQTDTERLQSVDRETEVTNSFINMAPRKTEASTSVQSFYQNRNENQYPQTKRLSSEEVMLPRASPTLPGLSAGEPTTSKQFIAETASKRTVASAHSTNLAKVSSAKDPGQSQISIDAVNVSGVFSKEITQSWIQGLTLVTAPHRGLYADNSLESVIQELLSRIANDETQEEFKQLKSLKPTDSSDVAKMRENKSKNRFRNVLPYDATRVILNNDEDYINASHVQKAMGKDCYQYIACQGPLPQTADHFWEMIMEQNVTAIAMVTQDVEGGKVKCHRYWPDSLHTPMNINDSYEVSLTKVFQLHDYDIRHLEVKDLDTYRKHRILHLNYTRWPDHGMPESAIPLLQYIRTVRELHSGGPILVHCSAGIGRTGTLITLDIILGSIERDLKFDIHQVVTDLRRQRPGMIQTKDQYLFCYTATLEALESLRTETMPAKASRETDEDSTLHRNS